MAERFIGNENRGQLRDAIDKPLSRSIDSGLGREQPPPIRGDAPLLVGPHDGGRRRYDNSEVSPATAPLSAAPAKTVDTAASRARHPISGDVTTQPTPLTTHANPNILRELDKMGPEKAGKVREFLRRKG